MTEATPAQIQRLLAAEFERQGWEYDLVVGPELVGEIQERGYLDVEKFAASLPVAFLQRNRTTREDVAGVVEKAIGGRTLKYEAMPTTIVINDNRFQINLASGARVVESKMNVGHGTQVNINVKAPKGDILDAVGVLLRAGLAGDWNADAASELESLIAVRDDVDVEDVRQVTTRVGLAEAPKRERVKELLERIAVGGLGGALGTGLSAGLGELISQLPL